MTTPKPLGIDVRSLADVAAKAGILFGCSWDKENTQYPTVWQLTKHHSKILTTDNSFKMRVLRRGSMEQFNDPAVGPMLAQLKESGHKGRLHAYAWVENVPDWFKDGIADGSIDRYKAQYWLERHISEMCYTFPQFEYIDVVNECIWPDHGRPNGLRAGSWLNALGEMYIPNALRLTRQLRPDAKLVLNEAHCEQHTYSWAPGQKGIDLCNAQRASFKALVSRLLDAGVPLDAVGFQGHLFEGNYADQEFLALLDWCVNEAKLEAHITEFDLDTRNVEEDFNELTYKFATDVLPYVKVFQCWQISERVGARKRPFDKEDRATGIYYALYKAFEDKAKKGTYFIKNNGTVRTSGL